LFEGAKKPDEQSDAIQEVENCLRSGGIGETEEVYAPLYRNRCKYSNKIDKTAVGDTFEKKRGRSLWTYSKEWVTPVTPRGFSTAFFGYEALEILVFLFG
jgi:hypothetical protein